MGTLLYPTCPTQNKKTTLNKTSFLTGVCLINIRPKRFSENCLPYSTLLYPTFPTFPNKTSFLTLVCLVNIRPKQLSENSLPYFTLLYPTFFYSPYPNIKVNLE